MQKKRINSFFILYYWTDKTKRFQFCQPLDFSNSTDVNVTSRQSIKLQLHFTAVNKKCSDFILFIFEWVNLAFAFRSFCVRFVWIVIYLQRYADEPYWFAIRRYGRRRRCWSCSEWLSPSAGELQLQPFDTGLRGRSLSEYVGLRVAGPQVTWYLCLPIVLFVFAIVIILAYITNHHLASSIVYLVIFEVVSYASMGILDMEKSVLAFHHIHHVTICFPGWYA